MFDVNVRKIKHFVSVFSVAVIIQNADLCKKCINSVIFYCAFGKLLSIPNSILMIHGQDV